MASLTDSKITTFKGEFGNLQFNNDAASPFEGLTENLLNDYVQDKNESCGEALKRQLIAQI